MRSVRSIADGGSDHVRDPAVFSFHASRILQPRKGSHYRFRREITRPPGIPSLQWRLIRMPGNGMVEKRTKVTISSSWLEI